jgi:hypothetical protein
MPKRNVFPLSIYEKNQFKPPYSGTYNPLETVFIKIRVIKRKPKVK